MDYESAVKQLRDVKVLVAVYPQKDRPSVMAYLSAVAQKAYEKCQEGVNGTLPLSEEELRALHREHSPNVAEVYALQLGRLAHEGVYWAYKGGSTSLDNLLSNLT